MKGYENMECTYEVTAKQVVFYRMVIKASSKEQAIGRAKLHRNRPEKWERHGETVIGGLDADIVGAMDVDIDGALLY